MDERHYAEHVNIYSLMQQQQLQHRESVNSWGKQCEDSLHAVAMQNNKKTNNRTKMTGGKPIWTKKDESIHQSDILNCEICK